MKNNIFKEFNAKPIWSRENKNNHYVDFKKDFTLENLCNDAKIYIAVDSEYVVFING